MRCVIGRCPIRSRVIRQCRHCVCGEGLDRAVYPVVKIAFEKVGIKIEFSGEGVDEVGKDESGRVLVKVNPKFFRPAEVDILLGDPSKAEKALGWKREINFSQLVERMVKNDLELVQNELKVKEILG